MGEHPCPAGFTFAFTFNGQGFFIATIAKSTTFKAFSLKIEINLSKLK